MERANDAEEEEEHRRMTNKIIPVSNNCITRDQAELLVLFLSLWKLFELYISVCVYVYHLFMTCKI